MKKIPDLFISFIQKGSLWIIIGTVALVFGFSLLIVTLRFENDMTGWVDRDSSIGRMPYYINDRFGSNTPLLVAVDCGDVFTERNLNRLKTFTDELSRLKNETGEAVVEAVTSLANVEDITAVPGGIQVEKLIRYPLPSDPVALAAIKDRVLSKKNYSGTIVSRDGKIALVVVKPRINLKADMVAFRVKEAAQRVFPDDASLYYSGSPFLLNSIAQIVLRDLVLLVPLVTVLVLGILFLSFRTLRGVVLPLVTVLCSTGLMMGVMALAGTALNVLSSAVPVILIAVGSAYGIHVINAYYENARRLLDRKEIVAATLREVALPVLMAGLTTMVGFLSNVISDVKLIKTFGLYTAVGVAFAVVIALVFIPSVLLHLPVKRGPAAGRPDPDGAALAEPGRLSRRLAGIFGAKPWLVIAGFAAVTVGVFAWSARLTTKVDMLGYFSEASEPRTASRFINKHFGGFNPLNVYLKGDIQNPDVLKLSVMIEERIRSFGGLSDPNGPGDAVAELNNAMTGAYTIPETEAEVQNLWFFIEGQPNLSGMVTEDKKEALLSVLLPSLDDGFVNRLFSHVDSYLAAYGNDIHVMANRPGNPYAAQLSAVMVHNLLSREGLPAERERVNAAVTLLQSRQAAAPSAPDPAAVTSYLTGDESEIPLDQAQAAALAKALRGLTSLTSERIHSILPAVVGNNDGYDQEDMDALARSLALLVKDGARRRTAALLSDALTEQFPGLAKVNRASLGYALAPLLWETIPVPSAEARDIVRTTPIAAAELTGNAVMLEGIRRSIFSNQISSVLLALAAVFILNWITFRSLKRGLISLTAVTVTILINFGIMGAFSIPLDFVGALIASVAIGTGIDYSIHFISRFSKEVERRGGDVRTAYAATLSSTGRAIVFNALSVGAGFAVLCFSNVIPFRTAGILLAVTMLSSSLGAMTLLPAVLIVTGALKKKIAVPRTRDSAALSKPKPRDTLPADNL
ncbi:MAG: MMPL family transporter [Spirochaetales bacterium]|nr:MMPL family transporter [Spirochaetales bacterium]